MAADGALRALALDRAGGFVFDVDGTLAHRGPDGRAHAQPGALEVLDRVRASGRKLVLFTNGSHVTSQVMAAGLREDGIPIADDEMLTPVDSAITYLLRHHRDQPVMLFGTPAIRDRFAEVGIELASTGRVGAVFVAHVNDVGLDSIERAARAVGAGAPLLAGSFVRGYAGANGIILSRGAMVAAAIAKGGGRRPKVVGKPSRVALGEVSRRLGLPPHEIAVIGDDAAMDVALGNLGGARTVLVRSGISGAIAIESLPLRHRPGAAIDAVADLLPYL